MVNYGYVHLYLVKKKESQSIVALRQEPFWGVAFFSWVLRLKDCEYWVDCLLSKFKVQTFPGQTNYIIKVRLGERISPP